MRRSRSAVRTFSAPSCARRPGVTSPNYPLVVNVTRAAHGHRDRRDAHCLVNLTCGVIADFARHESRGPQNARQRRPRRARPGPISRQRSRRRCASVAWLERMGGTRHDMAGNRRPVSMDRLRSFGVQFRFDRHLQRLENVGAGRAVEDSSASLDLVEKATRSTAPECATSEVNRQARSARVGRLSLWFGIY